MSYQIVYDKLSVDMGDGLFMPVFLVGDNNSYTMGWNGRERRERNWYAQPGSNRKLWQSKNEWKRDCLDKVAKADCEPDKYCDHVAIDIQGTSSSYKVYEGLYVAATNKSVTFEKLVADYNVDFYIVKGDERTLVNDKDKFMELIRSMGDYLPTIYVDAAEDVARRVRRDLYPIKRRKKELVSVDHHYVIDIAGLGYFAGLSRNGTRYTGYESGADKFASEKEVIKKVKYLKRKRGHLDFNVKRVERSAQMWV